MKFHRKKRLVPEISVTSMVDVVLLLLFFFMVSTTFNRPTRIKIQLPQANVAEAEAVKNSLMLSIDAQGRYFLEDGDGKTLSLPNQQADTLVQALRPYAGDAKDVPFIINADRQTPHQAVMTALEAASVVGFSHISFAAEHAPGQQ